MNYQFLHKITDFLHSDLFRFLILIPRIDTSGPELFFF
jgi:hypothetical protein